ncbi:MAG: UDP-N-acetylmuramoylalanine--D-glutamate ligase [Spirochaetia bacterium]|jgi:UDP-N-acetylmuramoylalanine--D-glutamate ligase|nr:UDP-N-acetylmuramoylalanine--D-glutamate ligase [Spirochaetia bacterium]
MKVLIYGLGLKGGGLASANYFLEHGNEVRVTDQKSADTFGTAIERLESKGCRCIMGEHRQEDFLWADIVVKNPAISPDNPNLRLCRKITNDLGYLFQSHLLDNTKIIAITGTKGKTTTSSLISHVLKSNGHDIMQCGNMGISAFSVLSRLEQRKGKKRPAPEYLVIEFSSWQIRDTLIATGGNLPCFYLAIVTNFMEDHQNYYRSMHDYLNDKLGLFQGGCSYALVPKTLRAQVMGITGLKKKQVLQINATVPMELMQRPELLIGYQALRILGLSKKKLLVDLPKFKGVPHRIEWLGMKHNVAFVNDSAATIPEAVSFTSNHFRKEMVHLITGGTDKNLKPDAMLPALKEATSITVLAGSFTSKKLLPLLEANNLSFSGPYTTMPEAVSSCYQAAKEKAKETGLSQLILLSPGAASFDLFQNEFDRGNQFKAFYGSIE